MSRSLKTRKPRTSELRKLEQLLSEEAYPPQLRRAQVLLLYAEGLSAVEIAAALQVHPQTVYRDLSAFAQTGLACLHGASSRGAQKQISAEQEAEILRLAQLQPVDLGLPHGRWSLANLRDYLLKKRILKSISREHLRRLLKKGAPASAPQAQTDQHRSAATRHPDALA